ncbi:hypothetical protein [Rhodococcus wratislaviensis]|uniref:hypothetical protein n=1 Tax=Rhodococcus wratislaviensis TaxID=44752 RepID=UPI001788ABAC|nr:hypothetical protein [Rhodococcus wratislaviensis]
MRYPLEDIDEGGGERDLGDGHQHVEFHPQYCHRFGALRAVPVLLIDQDTGEQVARLAGCFGHRDGETDGDLGQRRADENDHVRFGDQLVDTAHGGGVGVDVAHGCLVR